MRGSGRHRSTVVEDGPCWPFPRGAAGPGASLMCSLGTRPHKAQGPEGWEGTVGPRGSLSPPPPPPPPPLHRPGPAAEGAPNRNRQGPGRAGGGRNTGLRAPRRPGGLPGAGCPAPAGALPSGDSETTGDREPRRPHPTPFRRVMFLLSQLRTMWGRLGKTRWRRAGGAEKGRRLRVVSELEA